MTNAPAMIAAFAEPSRRAILERLVDGPAAVTDLARGLPISQSAVSQHLRVLREVGLVSDTAVGTRRIYAIDPDALSEIRAYFDAFWSRSLAAFRAAAERTGDPSPPEDPR